MKRTAVLMLVIGCLVAATSSECKPSSEEKSPGIITGFLRIDGVWEAVALLDPQGRLDYARGDKATHAIPGCKRDVGRQGPGVGKEEEDGDYVEFVFTKMAAGRYTVWIQPDSLATAQLFGQLFWNPNGASVPCGPMGPEVQLQAHQWYRVDVVLGTKTAADTCGFTLGTPTKAQAPSALKSLVEAASAPRR
jgi:hypothetical protein